MSDDTEKKTFKSILSPHVAEFVPAAFFKKKSQDEVPSRSQAAQEEKPTKTNYSNYNAKARHREKDELTQHLNNDNNYDDPRRRYKKGDERHKCEERATTSWRQQDQEDHKMSKHSYLRQVCSNASDTDTNWRSRENEETKRKDFKFSKMRTKSVKMENDLGNGDATNQTKRNLNFQTSQLEKGEISTSTHHGKTPKELHRGFGRGRGRARNAWTEDHSIRNAKANQTLRSPNYNQGAGSHNPDHCRGRGSQDDKLKCADNDITVGFQSKERKEQEPSKGKNPKRIEQSEMEEDGWIQISKKKASNKALDISSREPKEKEATNSSRKNCERDDTNVTQKFENQASTKSVWKKKRDIIHKDSQSKEGKISNSEKFVEPNITIDKNKEQQGMVATLQYRDSRIIHKTEPNSRSKEVRILKKDDNFSTVAVENSENNKFELVDKDKEFPDLRSANVKTNESSSLASDWLSGGSRMPIISYSAALKTIPKPQPRPSNRSSTKLGSDHLQSKTSGKAEEGESQSKKKKKKKKKAKDKNKGQDKQEQTAQPSTKKTQQPLQLDLGDWLSAIEKSPTKNKVDKQASKKVAIATGVLQIKLQEKPDTTTRTTGSAQPSNAKLVSSKKAQVFHNILDSTAPVVKRGKEREVPKKKKPSQLKRIILKEREEKKRALESGNQDDDKKEEITDEAVDNLIQEETTSLSDSEKDHYEDDVTPSPSNDEIVVNSLREDDPSPAAVPSEDDVKAQIHSRRFREYCDNVMDKELNKTTIELLQKLVTFQDRQYHKDPVKSKAKRRYVVGLREVTKHLKLKKIKLVIISPNVERIKSAGGLDDTLHNIITIAHQNGVPVVFALRRQILGRVLYKKVPVSAIGVFNYDGAQDQFKELMDLTEKARAVYADRWKKAYDELMERIQKEKEAELSLNSESSDNQAAGESLSHNINEHQCLKEDDSSSDDNIESEEETEASEKKRNEGDIDEHNFNDENTDINIGADLNIEDL